jgi:signal transduction histidine kinase
VDVVPLSLKVIVQEALQHSASVLEQHEVHVDVGTPLVLGDRSTLLRVLENLLTNAAKFSPAGSRIDLTATSSEDSVELSVRDHGVGIAPEESERVFERFYRSAATANAIPGTGIGLAIVKQFVTAQGGEVGLRSPEDGGSEFWIRLRRAWS